VDIVGDGGMRESASGGNAADAPSRAGLKPGGM
jgi:hypothetical protein